MDVIAPLLATGVAALVAAGQARTERRAAERRAVQRRARLQAARLAQTAAIPVSPAQAWAEIEATGWEHALHTGTVRLATGPLPDPGSPGQVLRLAEHAAGGFGPVRALLAVNPAATHAPGGGLLALPVPDRLADPIAAAAWTYHDPTHPLPTAAADYAALVRRT